MTYFLNFYMFWRFLFFSISFKFDGSKALDFPFIWIVPQWLYCTDMFLYKLSVLGSAGGLEIHDGRMNSLMIKLISCEVIWDCKICSFTILIIAGCMVSIFTPFDAMFLLSLRNIEHHIFCFILGIFCVVNETGLIQAFVWRLGIFKPCILGWQHLFK